MSKAYIEDKDFSRVDFTKKGLLQGDYENCTFIGCVFSNVDLSDMNFTECSFESCDLSMSKLENSAFKRVTFKNCKLLGLNFDECNPFLLSLDFVDCALNYTSFFSLKLKNTRFKNCNLQEVEFTESNLTNSVFENCNLSRAIFNKTRLENADFRTAFNYDIDPEFNKINKAKFSLSGITGLLLKYKIVVE